MSANPALSVVICTHDRYDLLGEAIATLLADPSFDRSRHDIVVVDNTPAPRRKPLALARRDRIDVETCDALGLSHARNHGIARTRAPLIAFLDDDAYVHPGWCAAIERAFADQPDAQVVGGKVLPRYDSEDRPAWYEDRLSGYLSCIDWGRSGRFLKGGEWIVGANMAWRRAVFDRFGGFNTALGRRGGATLISNEETELLDRVGMTHVWYEPAMLAEHLVPVERMTLGFFRARVYWQAVSDMVAGIAQSDPKALQADIADIVARLPPEHRNMRAFSFEPADREQFALQLRAIYAAALMMGTATALPR